MNQLEPLQMDPASLSPVLLPEEVYCPGAAEKFDIFINNNFVKEKYSIRLTTQRLLFINDEDRRLSYSGRLDDISELKFISVVIGKNLVDFKLLVKANFSVNMRFAGSGKAPEFFHGSINQQITERRKTRVATATYSTAQTGYLYKNIVKDNATMDRNANRLISTTFQSLDDLQSNAGEIEKLITDFQNHIKTLPYALASPSSSSSSLSATTSSTSSSSSNLSQEDEQEKVQFLAIIQSLGIVSPVTRDTAGTDYERELSREFFDFCMKILPEHGGMLSLVDVYAMFNRARGINMISPEDLVKACSTLRMIGLGNRLIHTTTRAKTDVVHLPECSEEALKARLGNLLLTKAQREKRGMGLYEVSRLLRVSMQIAKEIIDSAEENMLICRDETDVDVEYYLNGFMDTKNLMVYCS